MQYTVKKTAFGKYHVLYECPRCRAALDSPIEEAGTQIECPTCHHSFVAPAAQDAERIRKASEEAAGREERLRQQQKNEALRRKEEARKATEARRAAEAAGAAGRPRRPQAPVHQQAHTPSPADKFLRVAFTFGKAISVVVVGCCFAAIAICAVWLFTVHAEKPTTQVVTFSAPAIADYAATLARATPTRTADEQSDQGAAGSGRALYDDYEQFLARYGIRSSELVVEFIRMDSEAQHLLLDGLRALQKQAAVKIDDAAVLWYVRAFKARWDVAKESRDDRAREERFAEAAAKERRLQLLTAIGFSVAALMSFLFLPLLIQIEQNTRHLPTPAISQKEAPVPVEA